MFIEIDNWLIMWANWGVRQIELYTRFTKRTVTLVLLVIIKGFSWSNVLVLAVLSLYSTGYTVILLASACAALLFNCVKHESLMHEIASDESRARENLISGGYLVRLIMVYVSLVQISVLVSYFLFNEKALLVTNIADFVVDIVSATVCISFVCSTVVEHVLCAQSMTPKEKLKCDYGRARKHFLD